MLIVFMTALTFFAFTIVLALQNSTTVVIRFLWWQDNVQIELLILLVFFLGFLMNLLISVPHRLKEKRLLAEKDKKLKKMEEDLSKYRTMLLGSHKTR